LKSIRANFARRRKVSPWWWAAIVALLLSTVALQRERIATEKAIAALLAEKSARDGASVLRTDVSMQQSKPVAQPYDSSAREMLRQHETHWPKLLDALEAVNLDGVRLLSVDYVANDAQARVEISVAVQGLVLEYVAALNESFATSDRVWRWSVMRIEQTAGQSDTARAALVARFESKN
jgi:hypothetical protein